MQVVQQTSDFRIAAKAGPAGNQQYTGPSGAFQATKAPLQVANTAPLPHKAVTAAQVPSSKAQAAPNAVSTARPAVSTPHLQLPKASHLNTAAPAFVPRTLRAAPLTTDAKPAASAAQPTVANTKLAAPTPSPGKLKAFKEFIPQRLLTAVQPAPKVDQHTQAAHTPATQPATQPAALAPSFARAEVQVAEQQPHHHPVANMQPAAESSQSPDAVQQPTAVAAQQGAPSDQSHQSTVQSDQLEVQPDQSRMLSHQAAVQSDQLVVQSNQSAAWSDQHDINARPAAAQDQWADTGPSEMQSAAPSVSFASLGVEVPALEDATEEEIEKVVLSEEALTWYCVVDGFYLDSPLFPLPVVGHSAFAKLPVRAEEVESLVHSGSISTYRPPGTCALLVMCFVAGNASPSIETLTCKQHT